MADVLQPTPEELTQEGGGAEKETRKEAIKEAIIDKCVRDQIKKLREAKIVTKRRNDEQEVGIVAEDGDELVKKDTIERMRKEGLGEEELERAAGEVQRRVDEGKKKIFRLES